MPNITRITPLDVNVNVDVNENVNVDVNVNLNVDVNVNQNRPPPNFPLSTFHSPLSEEAPLAQAELLRSYFGATSELLRSYFGATSGVQPFRCPECGQNGAVAKGEFLPFV